MAGHATRTTCFSIISTIEDDLRNLVSDVCGALNKTHFLPSDIRQSATERWQRDTTSHAQSHADDDSDLLPYTDFMDLAKILHTSLKRDRNTHGLKVTELAQAFEPLVPIRNRVCHTRPLEPDDLPKCVDTAHDVLRLEKRYFKRLDETLRQLNTNPASVVRVPIPPYWFPEDTIHHNLPMPEFDDTGFFGRNRDRREVHRLLKSNYPVQTIVGEGGVGKTALAQRCLYDLVDDEHPSFDAIVWVSLKTSSLTAAGVRDISNSISSVLGLLGSIAGSLGTPDSGQLSVSTLIDEVIEYLAEYRVAVAIDNVETIGGASLRDLMVRIPPSSKVLITSRVGLGEFEARHALDPLDKRSAVALMRRFAQFMALPVIQSAREAILAKYCNALYHNPLLIKWFVASVSRGVDPAQLLHLNGRRFQDALTFCCSRLFDRLTQNEWRVTNALAAARRPLTFTEIQYLCSGMDASTVESAIGSLHNSSLLRRDIERSGSFVYRLSEPARAYISVQHPPAKKLFQRVQLDLKKILTISQREEVEQANYELEVYSIRANSRDERIAAIALRKALDQLRARDFGGARKCVAEAKRLLPTYAESYRVASLVETKAGDSYRASEELDLAVQYAPDSLISRYTYALFLMREMSDAESALEHLDVALELRPREPTLASARAMALTWLGRYAEAADIYEELLGAVGQRPRRWRIATRDQCAECYRRWAKADIVNRDTAQFKEHLNRAFMVIEEAIRVGDSDSATSKRLGRILYEAIYHGSRTQDRPYVEHAIDQAEKIGWGLPVKRVAIGDIDRVRERLAAYPELLDRVEAMCY